MDKKNYESYEEIHAKLAAAMQEACTKDESGQYESPDVDLSFLFEDKEETTKPKKIKWSRFGKVAAIVIIALLSINIVMLATDSGVSYSDKGLLHRICEGARGIFTDEEDTEVEVSETGQSFTLDDFSKIDEAKAFWPDLYVPEYIPEGFEFKELIINKYFSGDCFAEYEYASNDYILEVNMTYLVDESKSSSDGIGDFVEFSDRKINIYWDNTYETFVADIYMDDSTIYIYGQVSKEEIMKIALNIK